MNIYVHFLLIVAVWENANAEHCANYDDPACVDFKAMDGQHFMNQWIAEIHGGEDEAKSVAEETKFQYLRPAKDHENHYIFAHTEVPRRHRMEHEDLTEKLRSHHKVKRVGQQYVHKPALHQLETYDDFVGRDRGVDVKVSSFDPQTRTEFYEDLRNERNVPSYNEETVKEEREASDKPENIELLKPLSEIFDIEAAYKRKEEMRLADQPKSKVQQPKSKQHAD